MLRDPSEDSSPSAFEQGILHTKDCLEATRVSLTATAARNLPVDPSGLVALGEGHVEPAKLGDTRSQFYVRTASCHVRRYGEGPRLTGFGDDRCLLTVIFGVENPMANSCFVETPAQILGSSHRTCPDKDRSASLQEFLYTVEHNPSLLFCRRHYHVLQIGSPEGFFGRHAGNGETVDRPEFFSHFPGSSRHTAEMEIPPEETLIGDPGDRFHRAGELTPFLDLDELMNPPFPGPVRHEPARILVDDLNLSVLHQIVDVGPKEVERREGFPDGLLPSDRSRPEGAEGYREAPDAIESTIGDVDPVRSRSIV